MSPASALIGALFASLWQVSLLAACFWLVRPLLRTAQARYGLGLFTLAAQVAWPAVTFAQLTRLSLRLDEAGPLAASGRWWWVGPLWLCGVLVMLARFVGGLVVVRRWVRAGAALGAEALARFEAVRERLGVRPVAWAVVARLEVPMTVGFWRPVVLLPAAVLTAMPLADLELIVAHELMHVRRWDYFFNLLQALAEALLFFHPLLWWVSRATRDEREFCCDDAVVVRLGAARPYALALVSLEQHRQVIPLAVSSTGGSFMHRIQRLLKGSSPRRGAIRFSWLAALALALAVAASAAFAIKGPPAAPIIPIGGELTPLLRSYCAQLERTAARPEIAAIPKADLATVVISTVSEENPGLEAFYDELAKVRAAQRLDTIKRSFSAALGEDWQCAKLDEVWALH